MSVSDTVTQEWVDMSNLAHHCVIWLLSNEQDTAVAKLCAPTMEFPYEQDLLCAFPSAQSHCMSPVNMVTMTDMWFLAPRVLSSPNRLAGLGCDREWPQESMSSHIALGCVSEFLSTKPRWFQQLPKLTGLCQEVSWVAQRIWRGLPGPTAPHHVCMAFSFLFFIIPPGGGRQALVPSKAWYQPCIAMSGWGRSMHFSPDMICLQRMCSINELWHLYSVVTMEYTVHDRF